MCKENPVRKRKMLLSNSQTCNSTVDSLLHRPCSSKMLRRVDPSTVTGGDLFCNVSDFDRKKEKATFPFKLGPASPGLSGVSCSGILDGSDQKECGHECVVAGEDLRGPPSVSSINKKVPGVNRTFDSRRAFSINRLSLRQKAPELPPSSQYVLASLPNLVYPGRSLALMQLRVIMWPITSFFIVHLMLIKLAAQPKKYPSLIFKKI